MAGVREAPVGLTALPDGVYIARLSVYGAAPAVESFRFTVVR